MRLEVTRRSDLAIRALAELDASGRRMKAAQLAGRVGTTTGFLPQVLGPLVARGWVRSDPGPTGGYTAAVSLGGISALEVIEAVEGPTDDGRCVVEDRPCAGGRHCALHVAWSRARGELRAGLAALPLSALSATIEEER